jgi:Flp pilus assembly protein TadD
MLVTIAGTLGGCELIDNDATASIDPKTGAPPSSQEGLRAYAELWAKRYDADPGGKVVSINYAKALRELTRYGQAVAVMETAAVKAPNDMEILGAYGKALADAGQLAQADDVLSRSYTPEQPNWSSMNVRGSIADQIGDHAKAQEYYLDALKIAPGEPSILNNLGLSYALSKQLPKAEETLRQAAASPAADSRTRANLGLVLALEGKFAEAEKIQKHDLSDEAASANVASIRKMIAENNSWREIQSQEARKRAAKPAPAASVHSPLAAVPAEPVAHTAAD